MIAPRIRSRLDRDEAVAAFGIGQRPATACEVGIERRVVLVDGVPVAPGGVGLPDLHQGVRDRPAVLVQHAAADDDPLSDRLAVVLARQIMVAGLDVVPAKDRTGDFR
jgi:hypothetical protein